MTTCAHCGTTWTGTRIEHCVATNPLTGTRCCATFTGQGAGDAHRTGDFADGTRRCLTPAEMLTRTPKPLALNDRGRWGFPSAEGWAEKAFKKTDADADAKVDD